MLSFFGYLADRGVLWVAKLLAVSIFLAVWREYGQSYEYEFKSYAIWLLNRTLYKVITESQANLMATFVMIAVTWSIVHWILPHKSPHE